MLPLRLSILRASFLTCFIAACASPADDTANAQAELAHDPSNIQLYVQAPLPVQLGQALARDAGEGNAAALGGTCIAPGTISNAFVEARKHQPTVLPRSTAYKDVDGPKDVDTKRSGHFATFAYPGNENAQFFLPDVARFESNVVQTPSCITEVAGIDIRSNEFSVGADAHPTKVDPLCGDGYARSVRAVRFLSFAFRLDLGWWDARRFHETFMKSNEQLDGEIGLGQVLEARPAGLQEFLRDRGASISVHILVSKGLESYVKRQIASYECSISNLEGCAVMHERLLDMLNEVNDLPGSDDTLDEVLAPDSTWGIYLADFADY